MPQFIFFFFFQAEDGIRDVAVTGVQTCALPILFLQNKGFRLLEALVVALIATIAGCFLFEIFISRPDLGAVAGGFVPRASILADPDKLRSEEHTSELQSRLHLVCRLLLEKKKKQ